MATAATSPSLKDHGCVYALSPDYRPELAKGHVLFDQSLQVEERIERAQAESIGKLVALRPKAEGGDPRSQTEFAKETKLLQWLCGDGAKGWVEENAPQRKDIFTKYKFSILDDGFVEFVMPQGTSYYELFAEANRYCRRIGRTPPAVYKNHLKDRLQDRDTASVAMGAPVKHSILGFVMRSTNQSRAEQEIFLQKQGLSLASLEAAAAAAVLYYCKTGHDLLQGCSVRIADRGLRLGFQEVGLCVLHVFDDDSGSDHVGAAAARNLES